MLDVVLAFAAAGAFAAGAFALALEVLAAFAPGFGVVAAFAAAGFFAAGVRGVGV